jgi:hypothetical protein
MIYIAMRWGCFETSFRLNLFGLHFHFERTQNTGHLLLDCLVNPICEIESFILLAVESDSCRGFYLMNREGQPRNIQGLFLQLLS